MHPINQNSTINEVNLKTIKNTDNTRSYQVMKNLHTPLESERRTHQVLTTNSIRSPGITVSRGNYNQTNFLSQQKSESYKHADMKSIVSSTNTIITPTKPGLNFNNN